MIILVLSGLIRSHKGLESFKEELINEESSMLFGRYSGKKFSDILVKSEEAVRENGRQIATNLLGEGATLGDIETLTFKLYMKALDRAGMFETSN